VYCHKEYLGLHDGGRGDFGEVASFKESTQMAGHGCTQSQDVVVERLGAQQQMTLVGLKLDGRVVANSGFNLAVALADQ
jgi:hypothetical protein